MNGAIIEHSSECVSVL